MASIILNKVKGKRIRLADLLYALQNNKTSTPPGGLPRSFYSFYLTTNNPSSKKFFIFFNKQAVEMEWETTKGLFVTPDD